jgi:hypothetical protein
MRMSLKYPDEFIFEVRRVVKNESEKNIILTTFSEHFGMNNALMFKQYLLEGKVTEVLTIPTPYLIQIAENLNINPDLYFEKDKDMELAEVFQRLDYDEKERRKMKNRIDVLETKINKFEGK